MKNSPTVFISHAGPDYHYASELHNALRGAGINAWLDQIDIKFGDNIVKWINNSVSESDYLLVLLSPNSLGRYWVETEWSAALMKEADLRRTFLIPVLLPGINDTELPFVLKAKLYLDLRSDSEKELLNLINRLKQDEQVASKKDRLPSPAPESLRNSVITSFPNSDNWIEIVVYSNRFARSFRFKVPETATPSYLLGLLREELNLKWNSVDTDLLVELSYTYAIAWNGKHLSLNTSIVESGVKNGDLLELWIRVTLKDMLEEKRAKTSDSSWLTGAGKERHVAFLACKAAVDANPSLLLDKVLFEKAIDSEISKAMKIIAENRKFSSSQIALIADKHFSHVDR